LVLAGGSLAMARCSGGCCNANPDPCCSAPHSQQCAEFMACEVDGGYHDFVPTPGAQCGSGDVTYACVHRGDDLAFPCPTPPHDLGNHD